MRKFLLPVFACALLAPQVIQAQDHVYKEPEYGTVSDTDLQARIGFDISKKIARGLHINWEEELRLRSNLGAVDRIHSALGVSYRVNPWFRVSTAYTFIAIDHPGKKSTGYDKYWDLRHRAAADLLFTLKTADEKWSFSFRERPQFTFRTDSVNTAEKPKCNMVLRHRVKAEYRIHNLPLRPFVSVEVSNTLNAVKLAGGNYIDKVRSMLGVEWRLNKQSAFEFYYRFDYVCNRDVSVRAEDDHDGPRWHNKGDLKSLIVEKGYFHILGVFYSYSF